MILMLVQSSDDEEEVSENVVYKWYNNRYLCLKYLGRGTFCRVWLVYDIENNEFTNESSISKILNMIHKMN